MSERRGSPRWSLDALTRLPPTSTPRAVARSHGLSYLAGGVVALGSVLLPGAAPGAVLAVTVMSALCFASGTLFLALGHRLPRWALHTSVVSAAIMISLATHVSGGGAASLTYPVLYVLVLANAFEISSWLGLSGHLAVVVVGALVALRSVPEPRESAVFVLVATMVALCLTLGRMVRAAGGVEVDALTGLPNRRGLDRRLDDALARAARTGAGVALAVIDLDCFKQVNDLDGHAAGDHLLRQVAAAWSARLPEAATLGRWGGDEFVLVAPGAVAADVVGAVARLRAAMPPGRGCTAGVATWVAGESASMLTSRADAALYAAKRAERGTTRTAPDVEVSPLEQLADLGTGAADAPR